jgi:hypothetical protein
MPKNKLTKADKENYVSHPNHCPYCESDDIDAGQGADFDEELCTVGVLCNDCGKTWTDVYKLVSIEED